MVLSHLRNVCPSSLRPIRLVTPAEEAVREPVEPVLQHGQICQRCMSWPVLSSRRPATLLRACRCSRSSSRWLSRPSISWRRPSTYVPRISWRHRLARQRRQDGVHGRQARGSQRTAGGVERHHVSGLHVFSCAFVLFRSSSIDADIDNDLAEIESEIAASQTYAIPQACMFFLQQAIGLDNNPISTATFAQPQTQTQNPVSAPMGNAPFNQFN